MINLLFLGSCAVLFVVPLYFVINEVYKDGVFGRGALLGISFCSAGIIMESAVGVGFYVPPIVVIQVTSFAVFSCWHLWRFHSRVLRAKGTAPCGQRDQIGCPYKLEPK